jgi:hypothetical protein
MGITVLPTTGTKGVPNILTAFYVIILRTVPIFFNNPYHVSLRMCIFLLY